MALIKFDKSHKYLDDINVPRLKSYKNNVIIERIDLTQQEAQGNIEWRNDGVYLNINGSFQRGFMYIKRPYITRYEKNINIIRDRPRFHILECSTIEQQKDANNFDNRYYWSNAPEISLFDFDTSEEYSNKSLLLCQNCSNILKENIDSTVDYHEILDINDQLIENNEAEEETDIFNRPFNWRSISKAYKEKQNYTCEECGFGGGDLTSNFDRRFIHTHHINPNELKNTHSSNLKALCILCHSNQDDHHQNKFEKDRLELIKFIDKYESKLIHLNNPHLNSYKK